MSYRESMPTIKGLADVLARERIAHHYCPSEIWEKKMAASIKQDPL